MARLRRSKTPHILGDEKSPVEYLEEATSAVSRESFDNAFRAFPPVQDVKVTKKKIEGLFKIADEFLRQKSAMKKMDKRKLSADYKKCKKLMSATENKLGELENHAVSLSRRRRTRTGPVAAYIGGEIAKLREKLDSDLEETQRNIDANIKLLGYVSVQAQEKQFTLELEKLILRQYPTLKEQEENRDKQASEQIQALIGAARAGAGLYRADELHDEVSLLDRIPMLRYRAKNYSDRLNSETEGGAKPFRRAQLRKQKSSSPHQATKKRSRSGRK